MTEIPFRALTALAAASLAFACSTQSTGDTPGAARAGSGGASGGAAGNGGSGGASIGGAPNGGNAGGAGDGGSATSYDAAVLADQPVAYWAMNSATSTEPDLTGNGHDGTYQGGTPPAVALPNVDQAADFNGSSEYLTVPSSPVFSVPTTGSLTWEAWLRPDVLQFPHDDGVSGYVDWLGKCEDYGPTCEWEARMYDTTTKENPNRPNRLSAYAFNPSAGLGSGADWQPSDALIMVGAWYHVVGEYTTLTQPADCMNTAAAPGSINIWVNGVEWNQASHGQTGCMSQYNVVPMANDSALDIGTMTKESFFQGAIGKVAIYDHLLDPARITSHYTAMTGKQPSGSCTNTCSF